MSTIIRNGINQLLFVFGNNSRDRRGTEIPRARTIKTGTMCVWRWGWGAPTQSSGDRENTAEVMLTRKGREHPVKDWHLSRGGVSNGSSDQVHRGLRNPRDCRKTKSTGRLSGLDMETVQLEGLAAKQLVKRQTPKAGRRGTWDEGGRSSSSAPQGEPRMRRDPHPTPPRFLGAHHHAFLPGPPVLDPRVTRHPTRLSQLYLASERKWPPCDTVRMPRSLSAA